MTVRGQILLFLALVAIWLEAGCRGGEAQPIAAEIDEPYYRQGQQQGKQGRTQDALASYLKVIEKRGERASAESHLEAGLIYLNHSKDPLEAYHHFRQYLVQQPNAPRAPQVTELLNTAKREFARTLAGQPLENQAQRMDLLDQIGTLQRENQELRAEMAALRNSANAPIQKTTRAPVSGETPPARTFIPASVPVTPVEEEAPPSSLANTPTTATVQIRPITTGPEVRPSANSNAAKASPPGGPRVPPARPGATPTATPSTTPTGSGRRHVVVQGDSLFALSKKYYGTGSIAKVKAIYEANRDVMKNEGDLRPGMELKIP